MKFTTITTSASLFLISFLTVVAIPLQARDVYVPQILYPHQGTVWCVGEQHNVTWDTSNPPAEITNKIGEVWLRKDGMTTVRLAYNFSILLGKISVQVPQVDEGDYQVVLFGDSGNFSPLFTIKN
jgi:hypothetical protein